MIQAWKDLRFSAKLTLIFFLVLSLTIGVTRFGRAIPPSAFWKKKVWRIWKIWQSR